jgi:hypothetical protein
VTKSPVRHKLYLYRVLLTLSRLYSDNRLFGVPAGICPTAKSPWGFSDRPLQCETAKSLIAPKDRGSARVDVVPDILSYSAKTGGGTYDKREKILLQKLLSQRSVLTNILC